MEGVRSATSPFWAKRGLESFLGLAFALFLSAGFIYLIRSGLDQILDPQRVAGPFLKHLIAWVALVCDVILSWAFYTGIVLIFKEVKTRRYPGTFVYCYEGGHSTAAHRVYVVGCFVLSCEEEGEMVAEGESYLWEDNAIKESTKRPWKSLHVGASTVDRENRCYILFEVCGNGGRSQLCPHVLLGFAHLCNEKGRVNSGSVYVGTTQLLAQDDSGHFNHAPVYAERVKDASRSESSRLKILRANGPELIQQMTKRLESQGGVK